MTSRCFRWTNHSVRSLTRTRCKSLITTQSRRRFASETLQNTRQSFHQTINESLHQIVNETPDHSIPVNPSGIHFVDRLYSENETGWRLLIGLEIHAQITSQTKLFSQSFNQLSNQSNNQSSEPAGKQPNSAVDAIDAALPGTLPTLNVRCLQSAIQLGIALHSHVFDQAINQSTSQSTNQSGARFERKHYFYCDLPQGYQITQTAYPVIRGGFLDVKQPAKKSNKQPKDQSNKASHPPVNRVRINRIQIEQDSGKNLHDLSPTLSHVDLNRANVGLLEIVSEPDVRDAVTASEFVRGLAEVMRSLGVSRCQMEDGSLRVDVNVSVHWRPHHNQPSHQSSESVKFDVSKPYDGERVEVKNLNSLRQIIDAIEFERERQISLIEGGQQVSRETRTWDAKSRQTHLLRSKENMLDYRFMLDPDLPELRCSSQWIGHLVDNMPELHEERIARLMQVYGLSEYDANVLASEPGAVDYFQRLVHGEDYQYVRSNKSADDAAPTFSRTPRVCCNWLTNELFGQINRARSNQASLQTSEDDDGGSRVFLLTGCAVSSKQLGGLIDLIEAGSISGKQGKQILTAMLAGDQRDAKAIAEAENFVQVSDMGLINQLADQVWQEHRAAIVEHQTVKPNQRLPAFLTGQLIKLSKGKANPKEAAKAINQRLQQPVET